MQKLGQGAGLDLIGDVHGHARELVVLLGRLGYHRDGDGFKHPDGRLAVFVGDLIDRGPCIAETLAIARAMAAEGTALVVFGNHELNALCYHTADPGRPGDHLRSHSRKNRDQHRETLEQLGEGELASALAWFRTLPLFLDLGGVRVVHAGWDPSELAALAEERLRHGGVTDGFLIDACRQDSALCEALENALKGKEMDLPDGVQIVDLNGILRRRVRIRWFDTPDGRRLGDYTFPELDELPDLPLPEAVVRAARPYPAEDPPVFFGHYWLDPGRTPPAPQARNVACIDYSVARGGALCAYRFDGERVLETRRFVCVAAEA